jgi:hypothetical protein
LPGAVKKGYVGIHTSGFRDFLLKPELLKAIVDCGFEHPSEGVGIGTRAVLVVVLGVWHPSEGRGER